MKKQEVFVTGAGVISALGRGKEALLSQLLHETTGLGAMRFLDSRNSEYPVGEVPYDDLSLRAMLQIPAERAITRATLLGMLAVQEALEQAGLFPDRPSRDGLISATTVGGMERSERYYLDFLSNDHHNDYLALHDCGSCTEMIADHFGGFSFVTTSSTACSSAANAIILGANMIRAGEMDRMVVGGTECLTKFHLNGFNSLMILDKAPCRPFDRDRAGINLGEGAAYLVLESARAMDQRGATPLCRLSGYGNRCDAFHQTASSPEGIGPFLAMQEALHDAELAPSEIDYINAHGTATPNNDLTEGLAIMRLFGEELPLVSSTKSFTGHTTSAAGSVEAVIALLALTHHFVPANLHWSTPMEELSFLPLSETKRDHVMRHVMNNAFGFGGNDSSLIFSQC